MIQSNQEFRLNDTVDVNVINISMSIGGKGSKGSEVDLEKHLEKKRSNVPRMMMIYVWRELSW